MIPKFRAWDKEEKRMLSHKELIDNYRGEYPSFLEQKHLTIMQYVWLKDDNKKEVYTGDIVRTEFGNSAQTVVKYTLISFDNLNELEWLKYALSKDRQTKQLIEKVEIVGNKFENPKLLKKVTKE